ncbi:MAG: tetratricopeptide repeat protein [Paludibacteraceae bacterium]|nr:tetratricopeptide repeat protein [Paludibacteraceae bacterium]
MKTAHIFVSLSLSAMVLTTQVQASDLSEYEQKQMKQAIEYCDNGDLDKSIEIYNKLLANNPKNYLINYELAYAKSMKKEYDEAIKITKKIEKDPNAEDQLFQLQGNAYDYLGKRKYAVASYDKGLKRFPNSGILYMEKGNIRYMEKDYDEAIKLYEKAMEVQPTYPSPYFRTSALFINSTEPIWGLIYGETYLILEKGARNKALQKAMVERINEAFKIEGDTAFHISLTKRNDIGMHGLKLLIPFEIRYETAASNSKAVQEMVVSKRDSITLSDIIGIREAIANTYKEKWEEEYPNYLLDYQKQLIDGGYFEAFSMELFKDAYENEYKEYIAKEDNRKILEALHTWMIQHPFEPNANKPIKRINNPLK